MDPAHRDEVKWATAIIEATSGVVGFQRLASFACECDFFQNNSLVVKEHDDNQHKISVSQAELESALQRAECLFGEGYIYDSEPNGSFTWQFMKGLQNDHTVYFGRDGERTAKVGWHGLDPKYLVRPLKFARSLYLTLREMMNACFHGYACRAKFRAFDNSDQRLAIQRRLDYFEEIAAKKLGLNPIQARAEMFELLKNGDANRLWEQYRDDERVWTILAERQRLSPGSTNVRPDKANAMQLILIYLAIEY